MKKQTPKKSGGARKPCAIAILALLALNIGAAALSHAADAPILSTQRIAIAAQVGTDWRRGTGFDTGFESRPGVKLVPIYRLYGPESGFSRGSIALSFPVQLSFTQDRELQFGTYLSIVLWDGADPR